MAKKVAVEENLPNIAAALTQKGYTVVSPKSREQIIAAVVAGMDENLMNIQTTATKAPVINASGLTPEQIVSRIEALG